MCRALSAGRLVNDAADHRSLDVPAGEERTLCEESAAGPVAGGRSNTFS